MVVISIDPGPTESAYAIIRDGRITRFDKRPNQELVEWIRTWDQYNCDAVVIEQIRSYGMAVGAEVFDTCVWCGKFAEAAHLCRVEWIPRKDVKLNLCGNPRAKDANIRQAIIDRFGGKDKAIGKKANPGPLYGVSRDCWAAIAVGLTWLDQQKAKVA